MHIEQRLVRVDGGLRLMVRRTGSGVPPIICLSSAGGAHDEWAAVAARLGELTQVITYGRPGLGGSDPLPADMAGGFQSIEWAVTQLQTLLRNAAIPAPYVLLTSSLGSWIADQYAARCPSEIDGLVLVDPTNVSPWPRIGREPLIVDGDNPECCIRLAWQQSYAELHRSAPIGQPRCVVVSSADGRWSRRPPRSRWYAPLTLAEVDQFWQASQREWVHRLSAAHVVADTADHFVHRDEPALVAHVVAAVVESARSGGPVILNPSAVAAHGGRLEAAGG